MNDGCGLLRIQLDVRLRENYFVFVFCWLVGWLVGWFVGWFVGWLVGWLVVSETTINV